MHPSQQSQRASTPTRRDGQDPDDKRQGAQDRLFRGLDGRRVRAARSTWSIEVYGVHEDIGGRWVQLALVGATRYVLALRLDPQAAAAAALTALAEWLRSGDRPTAQLHVAASVVNANISL